MSAGQRDKWNRRFAGAAPASSDAAAAVLRDNRHLLSGAGRALDLACGLGSNALLLAELGYQVEAWDISDVALKGLAQQAEALQLPICCEQHDLDTDALPQGQYDVIIVSHFLDRDLCPQLGAALKPGGLLFYQTFTANKLDSSGPSSADFLLQRGELLQLFSELRTVYYREDGRIGNLEEGERNRALYVGQRA